MEMELRRFRFWEHFYIVQRLVVVLIALLLVGAPFVDLAWNEPALDGQQGVHCQLHANPAVTLEPAPLVVTRSSEFLSSSDPLARFALRGSSIFIPPRA
jgi:hypothetical protein